MPRKKQESASRSRPLHRPDRRERRRHNADHKRLITHEDDEETGNETMVEYSSEDADSDSESEGDSPPRRNRYSYNSKQSHKICLFCTRRRLRCWHETFRDVAIILVLILLISATLKDHHIRTIISTYDQISNFTKSIPHQVQAQYHSKLPRLHSS